MIALVDDRPAESDDAPQRESAAAPDADNAGDFSRAPDDDAPGLAPVAFRDPLMVRRARSGRRERRGQQGELQNRGGEPRVLAFFWAMYLLIAAGLTVFSVRDYGVLDSSTFRPAVQTLFIMVSLGVCALWPMVRLSQLPPRSPATAALADLLIVLVPTQGVLWPMIWLSAWPWEIGWGLAALFTSWTALVGALIAVGTAFASRSGRLMAMAAALLITTGAPTFVALEAALGRPAPDSALLASAYTATLAFTTAPSGLSPRMSTLNWLAAWAPLLASAPVWAAAGLLDRRSRKADTGGA